MKSLKVDPTAAISTTCTPLIALTVTTTTTNITRFERKLGGSVEPLLEALEASLAHEGKHLGGRGPKFAEAKGPHLLRLTRSITSRERDNLEPHSATFDLLWELYEDERKEALEEAGTGESDDESSEVQARTVPAGGDADEANKDGEIHVWKGDGIEGSSVSLAFCQSSGTGVPENKSIDDSTEKGSVVLLPARERKIVVEMNPVAHGGEGSKNFSCGSADGLSMRGGPGRIAVRTDGVALPTDDNRALLGKLSDSYLEEEEEFCSCTHVGNESKLSRAKVIEGKGRASEMARAEDEINIYLQNRSSSGHKGGGVSPTDCSQGTIRRDPRDSNALGECFGSTGVGKNEEWLDGSVRVGDNAVRHCWNYSEKTGGGEEAREDVEGEKNGDDERGSGREEEKEEEGGVAEDEGGSAHRIGQTSGAGGVLVVVDSGSSKQRKGGRKRGKDGSSRKGGEQGATRWKWKKDLCDLLKRIGGLNKVSDARCLLPPSLAPSFSSCFSSSRQVHRTYVVFLS